MGLDQWSFAVAKADMEDPVAQVNVKPTGDTSTATQLAQWRKFNALHGWMERLYRTKGGKGDFNCTTVRLDAEDLDRLEHDAKNGLLTPTPGFFFGTQTIWPEDLDSLPPFIAAARAAIADGRVVL